MFISYSVFKNWILILILVLPNYWLDNFNSKIKIQHLGSILVHLEAAHPVPEAIDQQRPSLKADKTPLQKYF